VGLPVALFTCGVAVAVAIVFGLLPAWRASRPQLTSALSEGSRTSILSAGRSRLQRLMIAAETALALVLLVSAALLVHSFGRLMTEPAGMEEHDLWAVTIGLPLRYSGPQSDAYWTSALRGVRELPQVASAAISVNTGSPLAGNDIRFRGVKPAGTPDSERGASLSIRRVSGDYFSTLGIPLVQGRPILDTDTETSERVVVLNELGASTLWPGEPALGKQLLFRNRPTTVVGIIPTFTITDIRSPPSPQMYVPHRQDISSNGSTILLRARPEATGIQEAVSGLASHFEPDAQVEVSTMTGVRWRQLATERFRTGVLMVFAGTAVFLAFVGIFGVVSHGVVQRTREIGLRVALGATRGQVIGLLVRQALFPCLAGLVAGTAGAVAATRLLSTYLFGVGRTDPVTFVAAIGLLAVAAAAAAFLPARRVNAISPMEALRHE
jgi:predicted permease